MLHWFTTIFCCSLAFLGPALSDPATNAPSTVQRYTGAVDIDFAITSAHALEVTIRTERLLIRSLEPRDLKSLIALFGNPTATAKYATGKTYTPAEVTDRLGTLLERWYNMDPYSGFAVTLID